MKIKSLFRNSFFSLLSQLVLLLFGFLSQRAMNLYMGTELVGMNGVDTVEQIFPKQSLLYHFRNIFIGSRDQPDINGNHFVTSDSGDIPVL